MPTTPDIPDEAVEAAWNAVPWVSPMDSHGLDRDDVRAALEAAEPIMFLAERAEAFKIRCEYEARIAEYEREAEQSFQLHLKKDARIAELTVERDDARRMLDAAIYQSGRLVVSRAAMEAASPLDFVRTDSANGDAIFTHKRWTV